MEKAGELGRLSLLQSWTRDHHGQQGRQGGAGQGAGCLLARVFFLTKVLCGFYKTFPHPVLRVRASVPSRSTQHSSIMSGASGNTKASKHEVEGRQPPGRPMTDGSLGGLTARPPPSSPSLSLPSILPSLLSLLPPSFSSLPHTHTLLLTRPLPRPRPACHPRLSSVWPPCVFPALRFLRRPALFER